MDSLPDLIEINEKTARILMNREAQKFFTLRFAENDASRKPVPRLWRPAESLPAAKPEKPLSDLRIALDPGHVGGKWAKMEERWFQVGNSAAGAGGRFNFARSALVGAAITRIRRKSFLYPKQ